MNRISLEENLKLIESNLTTELFKYENTSMYSSIIDESAKYSLYAGGKRLRPLILLSTVNLFDGDVYDALPFAIALEWIHTYSLIHDDLPAMDNDDYRRGKESSHKHFGEDIAILTGDALLTAAFENMSTACCEDPCFEKIKAMEVISINAGNMIRGQIADIKANESISEEEYFYIIENKTGALFKAAVVTGAYLSGANEKDINSMYNFAICIGKAFQIADDILDFEKDEKVNYAHLYGLNNAKLRFNELINDAKVILNEYKNNSNLLRIIELIEKSIND